VCLAPESSEDASQFHSYVAGADKDDFFGLLVELKEAVGGDAVLCTRDVARDARVSAFFEVSNLVVSGGREGEYTSSD